MIDIEAIRKRKVERSKPWEERPLAVSFHEEIAEANADIDALLAEVERLQANLTTAEDAYVGLRHSEICGTKCHCKEALTNLRYEYGR